MLDADGSADPAEIPRFVEALEAGADFAKGSRFLPGGGSADITRLRSLGNAVLSGTANLLHGTHFTDLCYGYNAFWARCLPFIALDVPGFEVETLINLRIAGAGMKITEVPSYELDRISGESNLNTFRDGFRVLARSCSEARRRRSHPPASDRRPRGTRGRNGRRLDGDRRRDRSGSEIAAWTSAAVTKNGDRPPRPERRSAKRAAERAARPFSAPIVLATGDRPAALLRRQRAWRGQRTAPRSLLFWLGILAIALPIFYRLTSRAARPQRAALPSSACSGLRSTRQGRPRRPALHLLRRARPRLQRQPDRGPPPPLPIPTRSSAVTPYYPGLEGATSALMTLTGLSSYGAGIVVVGAARLPLVGALFLLFSASAAPPASPASARRSTPATSTSSSGEPSTPMSRSPCPCCFFVMMVLAEREAASARGDFAPGPCPWRSAIAAIVVTHHLTSYAAVAVFFALSLAYWYVKRTWSPPNPWRFATVAAALAAAWLLLVASSTFGYLSPVAQRSLEAIFNTVRGRGAAAGAVPGRARPSRRRRWERAPWRCWRSWLLTLGLPFGLRQVWRRHRDQPFAIVFALAAARLLRDPRPAPRPGRLGDRQPGQRVPLHRPRLRRSPARTRVCRASPLGPGCSRGVLGRRSRAPDRRRDLGLALGRPARLGRCASRPEAGRSSLAPARDRANGPSTTSRRALRRRHRRREPAAGPRRKTVLTGDHAGHQDILDRPGPRRLAAAAAASKTTCATSSADRREVSADGIRGYYFSHTTRRRRSACCRRR